MRDKNNLEEFMKKPFYLDDKKSRLNHEWFEEGAREWVKEFLLKKPERGRGKSLSLTQLRKFYNEILIIDQKRKDLKGDFNLLLPYVKLIKSKVAYAYSGGSGNSKIPENFKKFMDEMIDRIYDEKDFVAFRLIFESIVGYSVGEGIRS